MEQLRQLRQELALRGLLDGPHCLVGDLNAVQEADYCPAGWAGVQRARRTAWLQEPLSDVVRQLLASHGYTDALRAHLGAPPFPQPLCVPAGPLQHKAAGAIPPGSDGPRARPIPILQEDCPGPVSTCPGTDSWTATTCSLDPICGGPGSCLGRICVPYTCQYRTRVDYLLASGMCHFRSYRTCDTIASDVSDHQLIYADLVVFSPSPKATG